VRFGDVFDSVMKFALYLGQSSRHEICAVGGRMRPPRIVVDGLADLELMFDRQIVVRGHERQRLSRRDNSEN